jgi:hypothetical protein
MRKKELNNNKIFKIGMVIGFKLAQRSILGYLSGPWNYSHLSFFRWHQPSRLVLPISNVISRNLPRTTLISNAFKPV